MFLLIIFVSHSVVSDKYSLTYILLTLLFNNFNPISWNNSFIPVELLAETTLKMALYSFIIY